MIQNESTHKRDKRPQKTPKKPHYKANTTRRERINAGKYNFGSKTQTTQSYTV